MCLSRSLSFRPPVPFFLILTLEEALCLSQPLKQRNVSCRPLRAASALPAYGVESLRAPPRCCSPPRSSRGPPSSPHSPDRSYLKLAGEEFTGLPFDVRPHDQALLPTVAHSMQARCTPDITSHLPHGLPFPFRWRSSAWRACFSRSLRWSRSRATFKTSTGWSSFPTSVLDAPLLLPPTSTFCLAVSHSSPTPRPLGPGTRRRRACRSASTRAREAVPSTARALPSLPPFPLSPFHMSGAMRVYSQSEMCCRKAK